MVYFPPEILIDIVRRVGNNGFIHLAPFIASGRDGRNAVFTPEVLAHVDLDEFLFRSSIANEGSPYRCFFMKCFHSGNVTAKYVEGLRRAVKLGPFTDCLQLMQLAQKEIIYAGFAYGIFSMCAGRYEDGVLALNLFFTRAYWLDNAVEIANTVMGQIVEIQPPMRGNYIATYRYPEEDVPDCVSVACTMEDVCFDCMPYFYSQRVMHMC